MKYADKLKEYIGIECRLDGGGTTVTLTFMENLHDYDSIATIKEVYDDFVIIGVKRSGKPYEIITSISCLALHIFEKD